MMTFTSSSHLLICVAQLPEGGRHPALLMVFLPLLVRAPVTSTLIFLEFNRTVDQWNSARHSVDSLTIGTHLFFSFGGCHLHLPPNFLDQACTALCSVSVSGLNSLLGPLHLPPVHCWQYMLPVNLVLDRLTTWLHLSSHGPLFLTPVFSTPAVFIPAPLQGKRVKQASFTWAWHCCLTKFSSADDSTFDLNGLEVDKVFPRRLPVAMALGLPFFLAFTFAAAFDWAGFLGALSLPLRVGLL